MFFNRLQTIHCMGIVVVPRRSVAILRLLNAEIKKGRKENMLIDQLASSHNS
jgi:hypothetical protein